MKRFIQEGPVQLVEGLAECRKLPVEEREFESAVLLGMGGSALSAGIIELLRCVQGHRWKWTVVRDYRVPFDMDERTLVFALSYSGETEETLSALEYAARAGAYVLAVSSGGTLQETAGAKGITWLKIPEKPVRFQPRFALYFMFAVVYEVLCRAGLLDRMEDLPELKRQLDSLSFEEQGRELAEWLGPRFPVIYTPTEYESSVARIWKIKFNENSKRPAFAGAIPETNHNELIAFSPQYSNQFAFLLMPDPESDERVLRRFDLFSKLMSRYGYRARTVALLGGSPLVKCLASLKLADWVTYYAAVLEGVDPISIPAIQDFKSML